jgi:acetolactate synthase-1/2/3 large subunit
VRAALEALQKAERPVIVAGGGVRASGAAAELMALAEALQIPVATSLNGKDSIPGAHPLRSASSALFAREREPRGEPRGPRLLHRQRDRRHDHAFLGRAEDRHARDPDRHRSGSARAQLPAGRDGQRRRQGDARRDAEGRGPRHGGKRKPWIAEAQSICKEWYAKYNALLTSDQVPIHPARMCGDLTKHVPDDAIVIVDTGHAGMWMGGMYDLRTPRRATSARAGHLGLAFCAGIGAKAACPDRRSWCSPATRASGTTSARSRPRCAGSSTASRW